MAINFLNTINFNQNELQNVVIDPTGSAPTTTEGAMYYDTTDDIMYYRNASAWVPMDGSGTGVTTFTNANGTFISAGTVNTAATGAVTVGTLDLSASGTPGATNFLRGDNTWAVPAYTTYTLPTTNGNNPDLVLTSSTAVTDIVNLDGVSTTVKVTGSTLNTITFDLVDDVTIVGDLIVNGGDITLNGVGRIQGVDTVSDPTDAASKAYVDGLVEGGLTFKGTFDANDGEIVSGSDSGEYLYQLTGSAFDPAATRLAISVGDYYVVATAGDFYGDSGTGTCSPTRALTIGDSIIAVADAVADASVCADWSIIESDEGVTSVTPSLANDELGIITSPTTGAVTVGIDIKGTTNLGAVPAGADEVLLYDVTGDVNKAITVDYLMSSYSKRISLDTGDAWVTAQAGPPAGTEGWVIDLDNASLFGTTLSTALDVSCEIITSGGETVYADITRSATNMTVNFVGSGIAQGTYEVILTRAIYVS